MPHENIFTYVRIHRNLKKKREPEICRSLGVCAIFGNIEIRLDLWKLDLSGRSKFRFIIIFFLLYSLINLNTKTTNHLPFSRFGYLIPLNPHRRRRFQISIRLAASRTQGHQANQVRFQW